MKQIHSSAQIDPAAELAADVQIGPGVVIGPRVVLGQGCRVLANAILESDVTCGPGNVIGYGAVIGTPPQDLSYKPDMPSRVLIGEGNTIRELATINRGTGDGTIVGDHNFIMTGAHFGHNVRIGNHVIVANNCLLAGHVAVDDRAFLGGGCVFHQFMRVGRLAIAQGAGKFGKDIPPFCLAGSLNRVFALNAIGLRRNGFSAEARAEIAEAFKLLYRAGLNVSQALAEAEKRALDGPAAEFFAFVAGAKKRGICAFGGLHRGGGADSNPNE